MFWDEVIFIKLLAKQCIVYRYLIICVSIMLLLNYRDNVCVANNIANVVDAPATASEALGAKVDGYRIVNGIAILPILPGNEVTMQSLLTSLGQDADFQGISMTLYEPIGTKPKILLSGNQDEEHLRYAVEKLKTIMSRMGQPHRLVVAAYLREITIDNNDAAGLSWLSNGIQAGLTSGITSTTTRLWDTDGNTPPTLLSNSAITKTTSGYTAGLINPVNVVGNLTRAMSKGKVIVGSEITIVNGSTAELKNDDSIPVPLSSNNVVTFNTQVISSDIKITPTIVQYNAEKPEESLVHLDVVIQLSVPTATVSFGSSSALEYTTQTLTSTHYVRANNERMIGGLFASDTWTKSKSGIPILMNIPILKKIFSTKTTSLQHLASVLTIAVRILPIDKEDGYDY
ncbi:MAG: type and secretion system protein [Firmicutes bacterium]|nr:type and secretion system protein [Bacillota bacterium]